jgi:chromosome segregation ATPase
MASVTTIDRNRIVSFGPSFERSDDLGNLTDLEDPTFSEGIMKAVSSIQERASQVEVAIALDELESIKSDHQHLKHALEHKELELRVLHETLKQTEELVSTLQLRGSLHKLKRTSIRMTYMHVSDILLTTTDL